MDTPYLPLEKFVEKATPKYNSDQEERVPHLLWDLDRAAIDSLLSTISTLALAKLTAAPDDDKELTHLYDTAERLTRVTHSAPIRVALIGAQGAGKSLLINALFDLDGVSLTGADGGACTASVVRYLYYPGDGGNFLAEIKFLDPGKRKAMMQEHSKAYFDHTNDDDDSDDEATPTSKSKNDSENANSASKLASTAVEVFDTLFGSRQEFLESWDPRTYKSGEFVDLCMLKCAEALAQIDASESVKSFIRNDQKTLLQDIKPYLTNVPGKQCLWPLVDSVNVRLTHPLLQQGIELIDLPGSGDTNATRTRHADEIRDNVDILLVIADTIRINTDDSFISKARAGILTHGSDRVKLVATKIDAISNNQMDQFTEGIYGTLNQLISDIDDKIAEAQEEGERNLAFDLASYKKYLLRYKKAYRIKERSCKITDDMKLGLQGRGVDVMPAFFHVSAASYMDWIKKDKIIFSNQPALSPAATGIPAIRQLLYSLPAQNNLNDLTTHVNIVVPTFIEKLKRASTQSDRDAGFRTLADEFDREIRGLRLSDLLAQAKWAFQSITVKCLGKVKDDVGAYKAQTKKVIIGNWFFFKGQTWNRVLKARGNIAKGASKAQGLTNGCNWNRDLAETMSPGFRRCMETHSGAMKHMGSSLIEAVALIHRAFVEIMDGSPANLLIIDRAKSKWRSYANKMHVKVVTLMKDIAELEKRVRLWATLEAGQDNNLFASMTDDIFDEVFDSTPPIKEYTPSKKSKALNPKVRYVIPKIKHQKELMEQLLLTEHNHIVDNAIRKFRARLDEDLAGLLDRHFGDINQVLENYSNWLRDQAPIDYEITHIGEAIRTSLQTLIPELEQNAQDLRALIPKPVKQESEASQDPMNGLNFAGAPGMSLDQLYEKHSKGKVDTGINLSLKRARQEMEENSKRCKYGAN